jgi:DNA methyltransferase 1-associated protein 1
MQTDTDPHPLTLCRNWKFSKADKPRKWEFSRVNVDSRPDLQLYRWSSGPSNHISVAEKSQFMYTDQEYQQLFASTDQEAGWTREETDLLFEYCHKFDSRFPIIFDRIDTNKSMEELKDRFYHVKRSVLMLRGVDNSALRFDANKYVFDKEREIKRKQNLQKLLSRSKEQIEEEEMLLLELQRFLRQKDKWVKKHDNLLRLHSNNEMPPFAVQSALDRAKDQKKKREGDYKYKKREHDFEDYSVKKSDRLGAGISLQSSRTFALKPAVAQKVTSTLEQKGLGRISMPTKPLVDKYDELRALVQTICEIKKAIEKAELDLTTALQRKEIDTSGPVSNFKLEEATVLAISDTTRYQTFKAIKITNIVE